jgi:hypothetical protein
MSVCARTCGLKLAFRMISETFARQSCSAQVVDVILVLFIPALHGCNEYSRQHEKCWMTMEMLKVLVQKGRRPKNIDWNLFFGTPYYPFTHVSQ